LVEKILFAQMS